MVIHKDIKTLWKFWFVGSAFFAVTVGGSLLSTLSKTVPIMLRSGEEVTVSVFRPFENVPEIWLGFNREPRSTPTTKSNEPRPELGGSAGQEWKSGFVEYSHNGEPIVVHITSGKFDILAQALPTSRYGATLDRQLWPIAVGDTPTHVHWPQMNKPDAVEPKMSLPAGYVTLHFEIKEVGPLLNGETVILRVEPPFRISRYSPGFFGWAIIEIFTFLGGLGAFLWAALGACLLFITTSYFGVQLWSNRRKS